MKTRKQKQQESKCALAGMLGSTPLWFCLLLWFKVPLFYALLASSFGLGVALVAFTVAEFNNWSL